MITQPNPHIEARSVAPDVQHRTPTRLPRRSHRLSASPETGAAGAQFPNIALAGFQILIGYEWLLAGGDKLLLGGFPAQLGKLLLGVGGGGQLPGSFASLLRELVPQCCILRLPHRVERDARRTGTHDRWSAGVAAPTDRTLSGRQARDDIRVQLPAVREASITRSSRRGTPRSELLLPGWLAQTLVRPQHCLWRFD